MKKCNAYMNMMPSTASASDACFAAACALLLVMMDAGSLVSIILFIIALLVFLVRFLRKCTMAAYV